MNVPEKEDIRWQALAGVLQRLFARGPLTLAEAQAAFDATAAQELAPAAVDALVARATSLNGAAINGNAAANGNGAVKQHKSRSRRAAVPRKLIHEPLEGRDLLAPLFDWLCGADCAGASGVRAAPPPSPTACYAAAW